MYVSLALSILDLASATGVLWTLVLFASFGAAASEFGHRCPASGTPLDGLSGGRLGGVRIHLMLDRLQPDGQSTEHGGQEMLRALPRLAEPVRQPVAGVCQRVDPRDDEALFVDGREWDGIGPDGPRCQFSLLRAT